MTTTNSDHSGSALCQLSNSSQTHINPSECSLSKSKMAHPPKKHSQSSSPLPIPISLDPLHPLQRTAAASTASAANMSGPLVSTSPPQPSRPSRAVNTDRPPPPVCIQSCIEHIESCTENVVRFNERLQVDRIEAHARQADTPDPTYVRKGMIPFVFITLAWVFFVYVWRLCAPLIQQTSSGVILGRRSEGIGLLVAFVLIWTLTIWSYVTVISTAPGHVKDFVPESDPPMLPPPPQQPYPYIPTQPIDIPHSPPSSTYYRTSGDDQTLYPSSRPYPSINAELENYTGWRCSNESMRVLPGSFEPRHQRDSIGSPSPSSLGHSPIDIEAQLPNTTTTIVPADNRAATIPEQDSGHAPNSSEPHALANGLPKNQSDENRDSTQSINQDTQNIYPPPPVPPQLFSTAETDSVEPTSDPAQHTAPERRQHGLPSQANVPQMAPPSRIPNNDPPPLSDQARYCHRCRRFKPPRAHHCRRCGTCVLKMDHHCPWVGGCVGARNLKFFFAFVWWVTLLEVYTMVTVAIFFHRGVQSLNHRSPHRWELDGFLISLFPITAVFTLFTGALLCTHIWFITHNVTTIEHFGINRTNNRENALMDRWFGFQAHQQKQAAKMAGGKRASKITGQKKNVPLGVFRDKREMKRNWDNEWGRLSKEANMWWIGGRDELLLAARDHPSESQITLAAATTVAEPLPTATGEAEPPNPAQQHESRCQDPVQQRHHKQYENEKVVQKPLSFTGFRRRATSKTKQDELPGKRRIKGKGAWKINTELSLGPNVLLWLLPIGRPPNPGLEFPMNPRYGPQGIWRRRSEWPSELQ